MNQIEAMKLALEALEEINKLSIGRNAICLPAEIDTGMDALRQAIAELEKAPTKYCPSENNAAYEKGFIDNMAKQRDSAVQRMVEANTHPHKELSDEEIETIMYKCDWSYDPVSFARAIIKASRGEE